MHEIESLGSLMERLPQQVLSTQDDAEIFNRLQISCHKLWDSRNARFTQCTLPFLSGVPGVIALCIIITHLFCLIPIVRRLRPEWTKPFVKEFPEEHRDQPSKPQKNTLSWSIALIGLSVIAIAAEGVKFTFQSLWLHAILGLLSWVSDILSATADIKILVMLFVGLTRPRTCPKSLLAYYAAALIVEISYVDLQISPRSMREASHYVSGLAAFFSFILILCMPFRPSDLETGPISTVGCAPKNTVRSPEDDLRPWQFLSASWVSPLIALANKRQLNEDDVWLLGYEFQHRRLYETFRQLKGSVLGRLLQANGIDCCILIILAMVELICDFSYPVLLQQLLQTMEEQTPLKRVAFTYAILILIAAFINAQTSMLLLWYGRRCYERSRGELIMMVYDKALSRKVVIGSEEKPGNTKGDTNENTEQDSGEENSKGEIYRLLIDAIWGRRKGSSEAKQPASTGKIFNLIRGDVYEVSQRFWEIEILVRTPAGLILAVILVWKLLGPSCFFGVLALALGQGINVILTRILVRWRKIMKEATDARLQINSEYIEVLRNLRWYGWHNHWLGKVLSARQKELNTRVITMILNSVIFVVNSSISAVFPVAAFFGYTVLAGHTLRVDIIFPALNLFTMLQDRISDIPSLINTMLNAYVSLQRINEFMVEPEMDPVSDLSSSKLRLEDCSFAWPGNPELVLQNVSLDIPSGLTVIHGKVGSGKTALLQAILGELDQRAGKSEIPNEMIGYCSQTPWLQSMSIRDNILFFAPFEEERYHKVLDACALLPDLANFKDGDQSFIGENGIGLSGGQKARVALARAVYSRSRILLLDDPLSALDHNTAESIVNKCLAGPLVKDRKIVLVTHRTSLVHGLARYYIAVEAGTAKTSLATSPVGDNTPDATVEQTLEPIDKADEDKTAAQEFIETEHREHGDVKMNVYWTYLKAGSLKLWVIMFLALSLTRVASVARSWFFKTWGEAYDESGVSMLSIKGGIYRSTARQAISSASETLNSFDWLKPIDFLPNPADNVRPWLLTVLLISLSQSGFLLLAEIVELAVIYRAAKTMFTKAINRITNSTFRYYDVTPVGRLMNRLTSDMGTVDGTISHFSYLVFWILTWIASFLVIATVTPLFLICSLVLMGILVYVFNRFLPGSQSLRRLETVSLSPLFANFGELLQGLTTVRAFHAQELFLDRIIKVVDNFQGMDHFYWSLQTWIAYRFECISALATFSLTAIALYTELSPGLTAFMLISAGNFVTATHVLCRTYGELQMQFISVERVVELLEIEQEPLGTVKPPASWPKFGADIVFENVTVRYAEHLDPSLIDISMRIPGGSTTAIVGRTGSGKSTLAASLLNIVRADGGGITIDGINLKDVDSAILRHRVTYIAQDPVLFSGTVRHNLDPVHDFSDEECNTVLDRICARHGWTLETSIQAGGRNLSQGQRQLIGITRAVLRRSPVIVLDEATASIDFETSMEIQEILRSEMMESTVITIAHRVEAVKDADYCIVLEKGKVLREGSVNDVTSEGAARFET